MTRHVRERGAALRTVLRGERPGEELLRGDCGQENAIARTNTAKGEPVCSCLMDDAISGEPRPPLYSAGATGLAGGVSTNPLRTSANPACGSSACRS
jgi:hypothetical protein